MKAVQLSIVIPLYNEEESIHSLFQRLNKLRSVLPAQTEVICVDDGSNDKTFVALEKVKSIYPKHLLRLSRNFGHQSALLAGLELASGTYIVTMDGDLQHPPELISEMVKKHKKGIDIVLTRRIDGEVTTRFKKITAQLFYNLLSLFSDIPISMNASDFRSMNRKALTALLALPEKRKFLRGMVQWVGFSSIVVPFQVEERSFGRSKYSLLKMSRLALFGFSSFTTVPLYLSGISSLVFFVLAIFYAVYVLFIRFVVGDAVSGWASVLFILLLIGGFLSLFLGVIGIYIAAIYDEVKQRPNYIIDQKKHVR